jgi:hypothetical protein
VGRFGRVFPLELNVWYVGFPGMFQFNYELQKPIARVLPHPTRHKRVKFFMSVWSLDS